MAVGRNTGPDISLDTGPTSPDSRVAFETAFEGESAGLP